MISRETSCNVELLKYQSLTLEEKIARFENMEAELAKLKLENQVSCVCVCVCMHACMYVCIIDMYMYVCMFGVIIICTSALSILLYQFYVRI